jgi:acetyl esterase/lipase
MSISITSKLLTILSFFLHLSIAISSAFAMQKKGIPVEYVLYPDEGHGFARPDNRIDFNGRAEKFLSEHLGGRFEAYEEIPGATATFPLEESFVEA